MCYISADSVDSLVNIYKAAASYFSCYTWFKLQINISNTLTEVEALWETLFSIMFPMTLMDK